MAQSFACHTSSQNLFFGAKNKLAGTALTKGNNIPIMSRAPTPTTLVVLQVVFALSSVVQYLKDDL